jgi:hypothetical protein
LKTTCPQLTAAIIPSQSGWHLSCGPVSLQLIHKRWVFRAPFHSMQVMLGVFSWRQVAEEAEARCILGAVSPAILLGDSCAFLVLGNRVN